MVFKDIQAILIPEFTIMTEVLDKSRISKGGGALKIDPGYFLKIQPNSLGIFTRENCVKNPFKIKAF